MSMILAGQLLWQHKEINRLSDNIHRASDIELATLLYAFDLKHDTTQVQQWLTDISATRGLNGLNDGFDLAAQYREHFETTIAALKALHPEGLSTLDALHQRFIPYYETGERMANSYVSDGPAGGNLLMEEFDSTASAINNDVDAYLNSIKTSMRERLTTSASQANESVETLNQLTVVFTGLLAFLLSGAFFWVRRPLAVLESRILDMAKAQREGTSVEGTLQGVDQSPENELGRIARALVRVVGAMESQRHQTERVALENSRIRQALDNVSTNTMVADHDRKIVYANPAVLRMLKEAEPKLREALPGFRADSIVGQNMDVFHRNPAHQKNLLAKLTSTYQAQIEVAGLTFRLTANPIVDENKQHIGSVVEWVNRTSEVMIEKEIDSLVKNASLGDLSARVEITGKSGFFLKLSEGLNRLVETVEGVVSNVGGVLSAMAEGDLTHRIDAEYTGAFQRMKEDTNQTIHKLTDVISLVREAAVSVRNASNEIAQGNCDLSQRTEEQASSLEETASSMEQMTSAVRQSANNAQEANASANEAQTKAQAGGEVVKQTIQAMDEILKASKRINDIIGAIDEIAFQTNLLALNAAVEAARAGEQGRGFAVVAGEVRNLSQRSAAAAKEIKDLIKDSVDKVEAGSVLVNESGRTLSEIVDGVQKMARMIAEINTAAQEQTEGIEQINQAVSQMDEMTQQNASLVEEASAASEALSEQANEMTHQLAFFKLGAHSPGASKRR